MARTKTIPPAHKPNETDVANHLVSLDKLLNSANELMKQEPTLDRAAFEYLRRLRVKVRFAISAASPKQPGTLPKQAPVMWENREKKDESPVTFIKREYAQWLGKGICRADIRRLDKKLYEALYAWIGKSGGMPDIGLPSKKELNDEKLRVAERLKAPSRSMKVAELPLEDRERLRLYEVSRRRRERNP
jgi:hypothetical protein